MIKKNIINWIPSIVILALPFFFSNPDFVWMEKIRHWAHNDIVSFMPYLLFAAVGFLSYQMSQRAILFACAYLMTALWFTTHGNTPYSWQMFLLSAPITLSAVFFLRQSKLMGKDGAILTAAAFLPGLIFFGIQKFSPQTAMNFYNFKFLPLNWANIPQLSLALTFCLLCTPFFHPDRYLRRLHGAFALGLLPLFYVVEKKSGSSTDLYIAFGAFGLLTFVATLRVYLQKIYIDELTGIPNRRALNEALSRLSGNYTIAMVDIDHFKKFNDTHGHDHGDNVLKMVGQHVFNESGGLAYRYGGEEFTMLFEGKLGEEVFEKVDKIRASLSERKFYLREKPKRSPANFVKKLFQKPTEKKAVKVTISIGVATQLSGSGRSTDDVFKAADECLYKAKEKGRNCVVTAENKKLKAS